MYRLKVLAICSVLVLSLPVASFSNEQTKTAETDTPYGTIQPELLDVAYSGTEKFRYGIAYTGGIKLGELHLEVRRVPGTTDDYELYALVTTENTFFNTIYPVRDEHLTRVRGEQRLPYFYEIKQKEGYNYEAHKVTSYDQEKGLISYRKNDNKPVEYKVAGPTHNEFSSFFGSRLMQFAEGSSFMIPTFADRRRVDVEVKVLSTDKFDKTALGPVETIEVTPILKFKGLYDKRGDTTIWYTNDECRVPVKITSKLAIGSITSTLLSYDNPACSRYTQLALLDN